MCTFYVKKGIVNDYFTMKGLQTEVTLWGCLLNNVAHTIYIGSLLKSKWCKQRGQKKKIQNKAMQIKINIYIYIYIYIYINKYIKRKHYKTLQIF